MNICIVGASGKTGQLIAQQALKAEHKVIGLARHLDCFNGNDKVTALTCDVCDINSLKNIKHQLEQVEHFIIALGSKDLWGNTSRSVGTANIIEVAKTLHHKPQIWVISAAGVLESWQQLGFVSKLFAKLLLPSVMKEHEVQELSVMHSDLPYTILRASGLSDKQSGQGSQIVSTGKLPTSTIERIAIADCIIDNLNNEDWINQAKIITGD